MKCNKLFSHFIARRKANNAGDLGGLKLTNAAALIRLLPCIDYLGVLKCCSRRLPQRTRDF